MHLRQINFIGYDQYILEKFSKGKVSLVEILYKEISVIGRNFFERSDPL